MRPSAYLKCLIILLLLIISDSYASVLNYTVDLDAVAVERGGVTVFRLSGAQLGEGLSTTFSGGAAFGFVDEKGENGVRGIVAVDLETEPGDYELNIDNGGYLSEMSIVVTDKDYGTDRFRLPKNMVEFDERTLDRIAIETELLQRVWVVPTRTPLWDGLFVMPIDGRVSAPFGSKRILNGTPKRPHSGMDIAAKKGTPVIAANSAKVAFVGEFFFNGNFVVLDHGLGVFTTYAHLSEVLVKAGDPVEKGALIGKVGSTGRSTGAHLHFAARVGRVRVSPERLFVAIERLAESDPLLDANPGSHLGPLPLEEKKSGPKS